jgi:hypothetical protein
MASLMEVIWLFGESRCVFSRSWVAFLARVVAWSRPAMSSVVGSEAASSGGFGGDMIKIKGSLDFVSVRIPSSLGSLGMLNIPVVVCYKTNSHLLLYILFYCQ